MNNKTEKFENALTKINNPNELNNFLKNLNTSSIKFSDFFKELFYKKNLDVKSFIKEADISRASYYEIFNGTKVPNRDTILKIALVLEFTREDTDKALKLSNRGALYPKDPRDSVIIFGLKKGYSLMQVDLILYDNNLDTLTKK